MTAAEYLLIIESIGEKIKVVSSCLNSELLHEKVSHQSPVLLLCSIQILHFQTHTYCSRELYFF